ncbi:MAG: ribosome biogenesis GTP-binding protein YihA/YsxC [Bdellovibrionaceae bacterium]|nr:ribosome biogenesis GTP-binding protein YihA/YsxC [Pseudobdellovibrionaceae bacterium]
MSRVVRYLKSAQWSKDFPDGNKPEIAITGRSNAGKSSFLNHWAKSDVARVSQAPGRTRLLNFFEAANGKYRWVDLPGYGFAARGHAERDEWAEMIELYLADRDCLVGAILVMDCRREWSEDEEALKEFMNTTGRSLCVVATKIDKLKPNEVRKLEQSLRKASGSPVFMVSNTKKIGAEEVEEFLFKSWVLPALNAKKKTKPVADEAVEGE